MLTNVFQQLIDQADKKQNPLMNSYTGYCTPEWETHILSSTMEHV